MKLKQDNDRQIEDEEPEIKRTRQGKILFNLYPLKLHGISCTGYDEYIILLKKKTQEIATFGTFWFEVKNSIFELKWNLLNKTVASLT